MLYGNEGSPMAHKLKAIDTAYKGHLFRSRLEARYAVFLDALGVRWQYEPEGFQLESGYYLPDFFLPDIRGGSWIEVKPHGTGRFMCLASGTGDPRLQEFEHAVGQGQFFVAYGIPSLDLFRSADQDAEGRLEAGFDIHFWCMCGCGKTAGIEFDGRGDRVECREPGCSKSGHGDKGYSYDHPLIVEAANAARCARFEHGKSGAT
jgi:hypothetical protein